MIDLVKPDDGESEFNSEIDPPERESRKMQNAKCYHKYCWEKI